MCSQDPNCLELQEHNTSQCQASYIVKVLYIYRKCRIPKSWITVKNILKWFRNLKDYVLVYSAKDLILVRYTNFDF